MGNQASIEKAYGLVSKLQDVLVFKNKLGSPTIPMRYVINVQKGGTLFYCLYLMYKFNNFSHTACTYMALHGTYGFLWLLKDQIFPDAGWEQKITVFASIVSAVAVLGPYWIAPYITIANGVSHSPFYLAMITMLHTLGCVVMMGADTQKHFIIKRNKAQKKEKEAEQKKGADSKDDGEDNNGKTKRKGNKLISDGWFTRSRNPNYLGEMMIYGSYALLADHPLPWGILAFVWGVVFTSNMVKKEQSYRRKDGWKEYSKGVVFTSNMVKKEQSYRRKDGWKEYSKRSMMLLPSLSGWLTTGDRKSK